MTDKREQDTIRFRELEREIDDAYRAIASAQDHITSGLDMDDYGECYSSVVTIMNGIETIKNARDIADNLDIDWETL